MKCSKEKRRRKMKEEEEEEETEKETQLPDSNQDNFYPIQHSKVCHTLCSA